MTASGQAKIESAAPNYLRNIVVILSEMGLRYKKAGVPYFALYELRHTFATRLSAGGVADHMVLKLAPNGEEKTL